MVWIPRAMVSSLREMVWLPARAVFIPEHAVFIPEAGVTLLREMVSLPEAAGGIPEDAGTLPGHAAGIPERGITSPGERALLPESTAGLPEGSGTLPGQPGGIPRASNGFFPPTPKRDELRRRKERFLQHPASGRTWEQVKERARSQNANGVPKQSSVTGAGISVHRSHPTGRKDAERSRSPFLKRRASSRA
jgi:hypothetical protein